MILVLLLAFVPTAACPAITIFERGKAEPTRGRLIRESATDVTIEESLPGGLTRERTIPRTQIEDSIDPISPERLAALSPDKPQEYRNYAEELAEKRVDPDAQAAAIRLYLIGAWLDPEGLAKSSLLGMTALARTPQEERRFRAMAYLYDPDHDRRLLREAEHAPAAAAPSETGDALRRTLQLRRQGNRRSALLNLSRPGVTEELQKYSDLLTPDEFNQPGLSDSLLQKIVSLELALESGDRPASDGPLAWSQIGGEGATVPVASLRWESLTEFDPRQCVYRNGRWMTEGEGDASSQ
jgi:hypothetical protein